MKNEIYMDVLHKNGEFVLCMVTKNFIYVDRK